MKFKKGMISEYLPWLIIGIAVLAIVLIFLFFLREKGSSAIDLLKGLFKGR